MAAANPDGLPDPGDAGVPSVDVLPGQGGGTDDSQQYIEPPQGPDQATIDQVNTAINQGYSYADISTYHAENNLPQPPQPSLDAIMSGNLDDPSQWQHPQYGGDSTAPQPSDQPGTLDTPTAFHEQAQQLINSGLGIGAVEGVGLRAAALGVKATTEGLGEIVPATLPQDRTIGQAVSTLIANKWTRRLGAATALSGIFQAGSTREQ